MCNEEKSQDARRERERLTNVRTFALNAIYKFGAS